MKIQKITFEHRNDFYAILECEHCQATQELKSGYNDSYYHNSVLPAIKCKACGKDRRGSVDAKAFGQALHDNMPYNPQFYTKNKAMLLNFVSYYESCKKEENV